VPKRNIGVIELVGVPVDDMEARPPGLCPRRTDPWPTRGPGTAASRRRETRTAQCVLLISHRTLTTRAHATVLHSWGLSTGYQYTHPPPSVEGGGSGTPRRTRTPSLLVRSQTLYPIELWALQSVAEREGFEPSVRLPVQLLSRQLPSAARAPLHRLRGHRSTTGTDDGGGRGTRTPKGRSPAVFKTAALPVRSSPPTSRGSIARASGGVKPNHPLAAFT
jgi:hypothetical protein